MGLNIIHIIAYGNKKTERLCTNRKEANKKLPTLVAEKLYASLNFIENAATLNDIACFPPFNLHTLEGKRNGEFAMDLGRKLGYRIVLIPVPPLNQAENALDFNSKCSIVKCIVILEVSNHYE